MTRRFWKAWGCEPPPNHFKLRLHTDRFDIPLRWRKPRRIFVCSMSDAFHEDADICLTDRIMATAQMCPQHTFILLTKRAEIMAYRIGEWYDTCPQAVLPNVWLGVTAENQKRLDERVPILLQIPAAVRWLSLEPLLAPIELEVPRWSVKNGRCPILWCVIGCESGPKRRSCKPEWMVDVVEQCKTAGVRVFVKQCDINGRVSHDMAEWAEPLRVRQYPEPKP